MYFDRHISSLHFGITITSHKRHVFSYHHHRKPQNLFYSFFFSLTNKEAFKFHFAGTFMRGGGLGIRDFSHHYSDVIMGVIASQITSLTTYSGTDERKHQSSASLAFVRGIHRWPMNSPHKWPVTRKIFPFDDVIIQRVGNNNYNVLTVSILWRHFLLWQTKESQFKTWQQK